MKHHEAQDDETPALLSGEETALMTARLTMSDQQASVIVNAPVAQVYALFSHFNEFPKFMRFVKEVTYDDDTHSHWVADIAGRQEWDAENTGWIPNRQIGWVSIAGLQNSGMVTFNPNGPNQTRVDVSITYDPPGGLVGDVGDVLGVGKHFQQALQDDLDHFARMVEQTPAGALDPMASTYLFHEGSAAAHGETTEAQSRPMDDQIDDR